MLSPTFILKQVGNWFIKTEIIPQRKAASTYKPSMVMLLRAHLRADKLPRHSLQCSVTEHYCTRHPRINKKASAASLRAACTINTQRGTSTSLARVMSGNAAPELGSLAMEMVSFQHNFVFLFPEHLKALQNSTGVVILLVNSSCSILEKPCSHCRFLLFFPRTCLPQKESVNSNHALIIFLLLLTTFKPFCS